MTQPIQSFLHNTHIAYFTMEIALRPEIHTYSGGLGMLAGDTARSCADLQIPAVFVSLASRRGYLKQEIDENGRQIDHPDPWDPKAWTVPLGAMVAISLHDHQVWIRPWLYVHTCPLGNVVPVILLDTDLEQNDPADRKITDVLYGGDDAYRLQQEAILGIGGTRILQALGFDIHTYHMNEGHSALLTIELLRRYPCPADHQEGATSRYDADRVIEQCIFTTHTPVEAGHDRFSYELIKRELDDYIELAVLKHYAGEEMCNMSKLALSLSGFVNGVARRHAEISEHIFPGHHIKAITNGIHVGTWAHPRFSELYTSHFPNWSHEPEILARVDRLPAGDIWRAHEDAKNDLIRLVKQRVGIEFRSDQPLIGFARRMTGYKRPELLFADVGRLRAISQKRPFQVIFAGKAHPHDQEGKRLIEHMNAHIGELRHDIQMAFLPDYNFELAKSLVSGTDIWLNTPLPPYEASGTSGMKAAVNGVLNLSVLDGWWIEAWIENVTGWSIGRDAAAANGRHAADFYEKLEQIVLPHYYENRDGWIWMMKQSISKIGSYFNSQRMLRRYATEAYLR